MNAFHSNWTRPFQVKHPDTSYFVEDFELLTTVLSALKWREKNGSIQMVTDHTGAAYYKSLGLENIWDLGISEILENAIPVGIHPSAFWAAGKLFALQTMNAPCVMLDTDFIVWDSLSDRIAHTPLAVVHREDISPDIYPNQDAFPDCTDFFKDKVLDWSVLPCNTALAYIGSQEFLDFYTATAVEFMKSASLADNPLTYMVFAEQRLISMCAKQCEIELFSFSSLPDLFSGSQKSFTHIWGHKQYLRDHPNEKEQFCRRCIRRIENDFPQAQQILRTIPLFYPYY